MKVNPIKFEKKLFVALADNVPFDIKCDTNYKTQSGGVIKAICVKDVAVSVDDEYYCGVYKNGEMMEAFNYGLYHNEASICTAIVLAVYEQLNSSKEDAFGVLDIESAKDNGTRSIALTKKEWSSIEIYLMFTKEYFKKIIGVWEELSKQKDFEGNSKYPVAIKNVKFLRGTEQDAERLLLNVKELK